VPTPVASLRARGIALLLVGALLGVVGCAGSGDGSGSPSSPLPATTTLPAPLGQPIVPTGDAALDRALTDVARFVESARGLPFEEPVRVDLLDSAAFDARLVADQATEIDQVRRTERLLKAFGVIGPEVDFVAVATAALTSGVIGFYDPKTKALVVRGTEPNAFTRMVAAHELTHALDDQWFDIDNEASMADADRAYAYLALVEGDATRVEEDYVASLTALERAEIQVTGSKMFSGVDLSAIPPSLQESLESPYSAGRRFVEHVMKQGGLSRLDEVFAAPPVSSAQILQPPRYDAGDQPVAVDPPPADGEAVDRGVFGAIDILDLLSVSLPAVTARAAADTWAGGSYVVWADGARNCVRVDLAPVAAGMETLDGAFTEWSREVREASVVRLGPDRLRVTSCN